MYSAGTCSRLSLNQASTDHIMDEDGLNNGRRTVAVSAVVLSLATLFASGRVFCRIRMLDFLYADDWIIVLSLVCCPLIEDGPTPLILHSKPN